MQEQISETCCASSDSTGPLEPKMPDVAGLIGTRWREWGGVDGPFGAVLSGEEPIPGTAGRRQNFERGQMVWAPEQDMLVSAFRLRNNVCLQWSIPQFDFKYFRCNAFFNGQSQYLHEHAGVETIGPCSDLQVWLRLQGFGDYEFHVASFDDDDHTARGWTVPVHIRLGRVPGLAPPPLPVDPPFIERWHELGASAGPMGLPTSLGEQFAAPDGSTAWLQNFEHGQVITHFALGEDFMMSAHQVGSTIELNWGGFTRPFNRFRVDITRNGSSFEQVFVEVEETALEWARPWRGSGLFRFSPPIGDAIYSFVVNPGHDWGISTGPFGSETGPFDPGSFLSTAPVTVRYIQPAVDAYLDPLPLDGSPGHAFASHTVRARAIARHFVQTRRMDGPTNITDENSSIQLIAHLHVLSVDPEFHIPGGLPHRLVVNTLLRSSTQGVGAMGTSFRERLPSDDFPFKLLSRPGDYDMALKGLMVVLYRYRNLLNVDQVDFILRDLIPSRLPGPIDPSLEWFWLLSEKAPETEN
ncbi:LGFP repeat-containing protein, partial [Streptomyces sp. NPDC059468]|uniref:LGFP repeat-containing protein n=1 Tax=Streptomyces sp. NPDC059468 TaxID=3346845 RepID=UPI0036AB0B17